MNFSQYLTETNRMKWIQFGVDGFSRCKIKITNNRSYFSSGHVIRMRSGTKAVRFRDDLNTHSFCSKGSYNEQFIQRVFSRAWCFTSFRLFPFFTVFVWKVSFIFTKSCLFSEELFTVWFEITSKSPTYDLNVIAVTFKQWTQ